MILIFTLLFLLSLVNGEGFSPYFTDTSSHNGKQGAGGLNGGIRYDSPSGGGFNVGGIVDSHGHAQGVSAGIKIPTGENHHINVGGFRGRQGHFAGGGASWTFKF
jgi:hypothetical protein